MERMKNLAYYNGKITSIEDMMIPANDRGFYFGDGMINQRTSRPAVSGRRSSQNKIGV